MQLSCAALLEGFETSLTGAMSMRRFAWGYGCMRRFVLVQYARSMQHVRACLLTCISCVGVVCVFHMYLYNTISILYALRDSADPPPMTDWNEIGE